VVHDLETHAEVGVRTAPCVRNAAGERLASGPALGAQASLAKEAKGTGVTVHLASPGMVATDLLAASVAHNPRAAGVLNILAEEPRTVARWLAPRMRVCIGLAISCSAPADHRTPCRQYSRHAMARLHVGHHAMSIAPAAA